MIAAAPLIRLPFGQDYVGESSTGLGLLTCGLVACAVAPALVWFSAQ